MIEKPTMRETTTARMTPAAPKMMKRLRRRALSTASKSDGGIVASRGNFSTSERLLFCGRG